MTLRWKTLLAVGATACLSLAPLYGVSRKLLIEGCDRREVELASLRTEQAIAGLQDAIEDLDRTALTYASLTDTHGFIRDQDDPYSVAEFGDRTFEDRSPDLIVVADDGGTIVFGRSYDGPGRAVAYPTGLTEDPAFQGLLVQHRSSTSGARGVLMLKEGPMLVASRPILASERGGPVQGSLIVGRYLTESDVAGIGREIGQPLRVFVASNRDLPADVETARSFLSPSSPLFTQIIDDGKIAGYGFVNDINGLGGLIVRTDMPREFYPQGKRAGTYLLALFIAAGGAFLVTVFVLLNKLLLSRVGDLSSALERVRTNADFSFRVRNGGSDELGGIATSVNAMLDAVNRSRRRARESDERYRAIIEDQRELVCRFRPDGEITFVNPAMSRYFGLAPGQLVGTNVLDYVPTGDRARVEVQLDAILKKRLPAPIEFRARIPDGPIRWLRKTVRPILDENLRVVEVQAVGSDVTEEKRQEIHAFSRRVVGSRVPST